MKANITGVDAVIYGVTDMTEAVRFLDDWGLKRVGRARSVARYACLDGSEIIAMPAVARALPAPVEPGSTVREVVWGVKSRRDLETLADGLARDRTVREDADGTIHAADDMGLGIGFRITRRKPVRVKPAAANSPGYISRRDQRATFYPRATPIEVSHVVFGVPDVKPVEDFYRRRLGFLVSDRYAGRAVFLRCAPAGNHHHLFLLSAADHQVHFNHTAFKVRDVHEVIGGGQFLSKRGWETQVGPGRHFPSSACFWYFRSPLGGAAEYAADEDQVTAKWKPGNLVMSPEIFSEWQFARGPGLAAAPIAMSRDAARPARATVE